jgi:hypothetical protein
VFLGVSIALLTSAIDGLMNTYTGGAQAAGAGAVILIVMQVIIIIIIKIKSNNYIYQLL